MTIFILYINKNHLRADDERLIPSAHWYFPLQIKLHSCLCTILYNRWLICAVQRFMWVGRLNPCPQVYAAIKLPSKKPRKILIELFFHCARVSVMKILIKSFTFMSMQRRCGVFVSSHYLMTSQPEQTRLALSSLFPDQNSHQIFAIATR